jgi:hypothetical protein
MSSILTTFYDYYIGDLKRLVLCPGLKRITPISRCDACMACLGMEIDENGTLYVFCEAEDYL